MAEPTMQVLFPGSASRCPSTLCQAPIGRRAAAGSQVGASPVRFEV